MPVFLTVWLHFYGSYSDRACICCHLQRNETGPEVAFLLCFMESWVGVERGELGGESCSFLFSKHTANLNGWSINFSGIDLHQFCLHAHTRSHFIVNQSFWKHLTEGPVLTNKPSIPAACVAPLSGHKSAAAQTSAPFPSLSPLASLCLLSPLCLYRSSCFDVWVSGMEKRGERPGFFTTPLKITQG